MSRTLEITGAGSFDELMRHMRQIFDGEGSERKPYVLWIKLPDETDPVQIDTHVRTISSRDAAIGARWFIRGRLNDAAVQGYGLTFARFHADLVYNPEDQTWSGELKEHERGLPD
jgi:hypothetical protein